MTTNTNTNTNAIAYAYMGRITHDGYVIEAIAQGKRKGRVIASFTAYDAMLQAWDMCTTAEGMTDVNVGGIN